GIAVVFILIRLFHGYVTHYLCLAHPGFREVAKKQKWNFYGIPALITLFFIIYFFIPNSLFPYTNYERMEFYYFFAFPYIYVHYAGQHVGILSMYRSRAGQNLTPIHKKFEKVFCHLVVGLTLTTLNVTNYYDHFFAGIRWGDILLANYLNWRILAWALVVPLTAVFIYLELKTPQKSYPKIIYGVSLSIMSLVLSFQDFVFAWVLIHMQHFFCHFGLCGHMLVNYEQREKNLYLSKKRKMARYLGMILISIVIAIIHYRYQVVGSVSGRYDLIFKEYIPLVAPESFLRTLILGVFVGLGICHYWYDRLAFRFSDPEIKQVLKKYL
ncbi:MAG: hypothetical protein NXH75_18440, partial [Halobacteriovoraceae bacterium]|nr:hypothetical protein [Halobacteriovoraceae bacterium]